jgi:hypothetical protein
MLAGLGYSFSTDELSEVEAEVFTLIASEFNRLEAESYKRKSKRSGR